MESHITEDGEIVTRFRLLEKGMKKKIPFPLQSTSLNELTPQGRELVTRLNAVVGINGVIIHISRCIPVFKTMFSLEHRIHGDLALAVQRTEEAFSRPAA